MNHTKTDPDSIWKSASIVSGVDPDIWRKDVCGAWIKRSVYGQVPRNESKTSFRWQIDHAIPKSFIEINAKYNCRALQWYNNLKKSNGPDNCHVVAEGNKNVLRPPAHEWGWQI